MARIRHRLSDAAVSRGARVFTAVALVVGLTGCGTSFNAETVQIYDAGNGVNERGGGVDVLNALVVDNGDQTGTLSVALLDKLGGGDEVTTILATLDEKPIEVNQNRQPLVLCPGRLFILGPDAEVTVSGDGFAAGGVLTLSITFRDAEPVTMDVPVVARNETDSDIYAGIATTPGASAAAADCLSASATPSAA